VSNKIDGLEVRPVRISASTAVRKTADNAAGKAGSGAASEGEVHITSTARSLASIEQSILDMPAIDQDRVDEVEQRLASGKYRIDPKRVADGLLRLESELKGLNDK
jgi:negative regulator of flagellin synthesis FlgM